VRMAVFWPSLSLWISANTQSIFAPVYQAIEQSSRPYQEKAGLAEEVKEVEAEVQKADAADFSFLETRLRNLKRMAPDIFELILSASGSPGAVLGYYLIPHLT
jgi:hypothetical protein